MIKAQVRRKALLGACFAVLLFCSAQAGLASTSSGPLTPFAESVRHALVMLPYSGVFDNLAFTVEGSDTVILSGQVVRPITKLDAESAVRRIEGVTKVVNNIEVLPLSGFDDSIRWAAYRAIFSRPGFEKYAIQGVVPLRIIVKNGNITLDGFVNSRMDRTIAEMAARSVPGAFSVTNNLEIG